MQATGPGPEPAHPVFPLWTWLVVISCPKAQFPAHSLEPGCCLRKGTCYVDEGDTTKVQQRLCLLGTGGGWFQAAVICSCTRWGPNPEPTPRNRAGDVSCPICQVLARQLFSIKSIFRDG